MLLGVSSGGARGGCEDDFALAVLAAQSTIKALYDPKPVPNIPLIRDRRKGRCLC